MSRTKTKYIYRIQATASIAPDGEVAYEVRRTRDLPSWPLPATLTMFFAGLIIISIAAVLGEGDQMHPLVIPGTFIAVAPLFGFLAYEWIYDTGWQPSPGTPLSDALTLSDHAKIYGDPATLVRHIPIPEEHHATLDQLTRDNESSDLDHITSSPSERDSIAARIRRDLA